MRIIKWIGGILLALSAVLIVTNHGYIFSGMSETYFRGWKNANIDDIQFRDLRTIQASDNPDRWISKPLWNFEWTDEEQAWHEEYLSASFLIFHGDTMLVEKYWQGFDENTVSNSFSACKSIVAMATGLAVTEGMVATGDELAAYIPRFAGEAGKGLTVEEVLQMRSNIPFGEDYNNPFGFMAKAYYRDDLASLMEPYKVEDKPGAHWMYQGGNTLLLGELVAGLGKGTLSEWVERGLWQRMGAENDAYWGLDAPADEGGVERCFAMFYATPRDFARFGKLLNHHGNWNGQQLIDSTYMACMVRPIAESTDEAFVQHYGYQIWLGEGPDGEKFSCMEGLRGQFILSVPEYDLVVVRTGFKKDKRKTDELPSDVYRILAMGKRALNQNE